MSAFSITLLILLACLTLAGVYFGGRWILGRKFAATAELNRFVPYLLGWGIVVALMGHTNFIFAGFLSFFVWMALLPGLTGRKAESLDALKLAALNVLVFALSIFVCVVFAARGAFKLLITAGFCN